MLLEIDEQLQFQPNVVVAPVGVGSLAQSIVSHYKTGNGVTAVLTVEPDTAASLYKSLKIGSSTTITTSSSIMTGLECGTISTAAWPILEKGIDASTTVSDFEVYEAIRYLENAGVFAGPCGAAALAGFKHVARKAPHLLGLDKDAVVVLICTEGSRDYKIPKSVAQDDLSTLTRNLEQLGSSSSEGTGKIDRTAYIAQWLEYRDIEVHWVENIPSQPSIIGTSRGDSGEKSIELNTHSDPIEDLAASLIALSRSQAANLNGELF
jgi:threonine synthase